MTSGSTDLELAILRFPLAEYLEPFNPFKVGTREVMLMCPKCWREKLAVNVESKTWHCFICEQKSVDKYGKARTTYGGGSLVGLVMWLEGLQADQAIKRIIALTKPTSVHDEYLPPVRFQNQTPTDLTPRVPTGLPENCLAVTGILPYMERRQISLEDARSFGLGYCTTGWVANRLVFPVWEGGRCLYWQARAMWDEHEHVARPRWRSDGSWDKDKYTKTLNPARERKGVHYFGSGDVVLNLDQARHFPRVVITEGPTSCIRVGPYAVATFGKQLQPAQISRLITAGVSAVDFMWDGPSPKEPLGGWPSMIRGAHQLAPFMDVRLVFLPHGDPGDYTRADLEALRQHARPLASVGNTL